MIPSSTWLETWSVVWDRKYWSGHSPEAREIWGTQVLNTTAPSLALAPWCLMAPLPLLTSDTNILYHRAVLPGQRWPERAAQIEKAAGDNSAVIGAHQDAYLEPDTVGLRA